MPEISNCFSVIFKKFRFKGNFEEILTQSFHIDVFRRNIIEILKEFGRNFEEKVGVQKMEEKKNEKRGRKWKEKVKQKHREKADKTVSLIQIVNTDIFL